MSDRLGQGAAWLSAQRHAHATRPVLYERDGALLPLQATVGRTLFEETDNYGVVHPIESRDYLIRSADLVLAGQPAVPRAGDRLRESLGGAVHVYEVMAFGGAPPWRYSDSVRATLRIHTRHVETIK